MYGLSTAVLLFSMYVELACSYVIGLDPNPLLKINRLATERFDWRIPLSQKDGRSIVLDVCENYNAVKNSLT